MSFSDLTRSYTTFPSLSPTFTSSPRPSPISPSSTAQTGASNIPGYSIAAGETTRAPSASAVVGSASAAQGGGRVDEGLALGLGLGLGLAALVAVLAAVFVVRQRKAQREEFDRRAEGIKATMSQVQERERERQ
ncbi:hypothetical protein NBRC10512_007679 [Rhodotorula toruloides]|uniref:RHTO0S05e00386g1_1 n=2 Tax=Rhodotorula toruloides TaxID=5286 RepID=A0A061AXY2_RHOTO|nr:uncharacterized protein RHTO_02345 [Rhodotorula toruloides NP11]EMS20731.1 hypothetical protein RHTO_02345 [Rhodotorula toruloides NP11]KAJ8294381.1 hypothetical protein OF846_002906 [Rhodotorula toruloides]KAJ8294382.1 hypothetical protein OF846_002906 [Rhodotorula toruloides]CDR40263.1 RHTO0S05e00386g1_1 [Rhodotorula toruloides]